MAKKPQPITTICDSSSQLKYLSERTDKLKQLDSVFQKLLPKQLYGHCRLANITMNSLIVQTDSAQFASLLRFDAPRICKLMSEHLTKSISHMKVTVNADLRTVKPKEKYSKVLSASAADTLHQAAESMDDGELKMALNRLAKRHHS